MENEDTGASRERIVAHLRRFREVWDAGGAGALRTLPSVFSEVTGYAPDDAEARAELYEVLGYDALTVGRPGWAFVCLRAASEQYDLAGARSELQRVRSAARQVLESSYAPYHGDGECLEDIRRWARARIDEVAALAAGARELPGSGIDATTALKHEWTFRLMRTREAGQRLRFDVFAEQFALSPEDRVLLQVLVALHWDPEFTHAKHGAGYDGGPLTIRQLVDLVSEEPRRRLEWVDRFDPRDPLLAWELVHVGGAGALRDRPIEPDESVLAWLDGRDAWPFGLRDVARVWRSVERAVPSYLVEALGRLDRVRQRRGAAQPHVVLPCSSSAGSRWLLEVWAAARGFPVIEVETLDLTPSQVRAVGREALLREAVVFVPREAGSDPSALAAVARINLLVDVPLERALPAWTHLTHAVAIEVPPPARALRPALWNETLIARGLAELSPESLDEHLGPYAVHPPEMARVVAHAADRAWLAREETGPVQVDPSLLRDTLVRDPELSARLESSPSAR